MTLSALAILCFRLLIKLFLEWEGVYKLSKEDYCERYALIALARESQGINFANGVIAYDRYLSNCHFRVRKSMIVRMFEFLMNHRP